MKQYTLKLKGTKKNNTPSIELLINSDNKSQAFNFAWQFFEKGETNIIYGTLKTGLSSIHKWIPAADQFRDLAGKYRVTKSSIQLAI